MRNRLSIFLVFGVVAIVALAAPSCSRAKQTDTQTTDQTPTDQPADTGDFGSQVEDNGNGLPDPNISKTALVQEAQEATTAIKLLKNDVVLQLVSMKFINSLSDTGGLSTNYFIYSSPSDPNFYYMVNALRNGEDKKRFLMPKEDLDLNFDLTPIPFANWKKTYVEALQLTETQGGADFRKAHTNYEVSVILASPVGGTLSWFISYKANDTSGAVFQASVDAATGAVNVVK